MNNEKTNKIARPSVVKEEKIFCYFDFFDSEFGFKSFIG